MHSGIRECCGEIFVDQVLEVAILDLSIKDPEMILALVLFCIIAIVSVNASSGVLGQQLSVGAIKIHSKAAIPKPNAPAPTKLQKSKKVDVSNDEILMAAEQVGVIIGRNFLFAACLRLKFVRK
jgi:hypothetical protein